MLTPNSSPASACVISFFLAFFNVTSRSRSAWVISSCPSCIPKAWGCQDDISTLLKDDILILLPQAGVCHRQECVSQESASCQCMILIASARGRTLGGEADGLRSKDSA